MLTNRLALALAGFICVTGCAGGGLPSATQVGQGFFPNGRPDGNRFTLANLTTLGLRPNHLIVAKDGSIWFTADREPDVVQVKTDGTIRTWHVPAFSKSGTAFPQYIVAGRDGSIWFDYLDSTYQGCYNGISHIVNGELKRFPDRACTGAGPGSMALGSDGRIYVVEFGADQIEFVGGRGPVGYVELNGKGGYAFPHYITSGSDGNLWISANLFVIRLSTNGYTTKYFRVGPDQYPPPNIASEIVTGPDGNLWLILKHYGDSRASILKITPKGHITTYNVKAPHYPMSLTPGPDGSVWFIDLAKPSEIGLVSPSGSFAYHAVDNDLGAVFLSLGWNAGRLLDVGGKTKFLRRPRHFFTATVQ